MVQTHQKLPPEKYHDSFIDRTFVTESDELSERENEVRVEIPMSQIISVQPSAIFFLGICSSVVLSNDVLQTFFFPLIWK